MTNTSFINQRLVTLDVFRGLTILLMILVNSPGNRHPYPILDHAAWNGCTVADLVFPFFLFIVGVTSVISLNKQMKKKGISSKNIYYGIIQRSLILFSLGLILNIFPNHFDLNTLRYYGILQRIAICYLICSFIYLNTGFKTQCLIFLFLLWFYWLIMTIIPVPGLGPNILTEQGTWVAYIDQMLFSSGHLLAKVYDPEGFLSTFPSLASTLLGVLTGTVILSSISNIRKSSILLSMGLLFLLLGWFWNFSFPINKNLWTSSYVLWTGGLALIIFTLCFIVIDIRGYTRWALPLRIFGMNALFAFVFHVLLLKLQGYFFVTLSNGTRENIRMAITDTLFGTLSPPNAALLYSCIFILLNFLVVWFLYNRKIFIRV